MKLSTKTFAGVLVAACGFVGTAQASNNDVENILSSLMKEALYEVSSEITTNVKRSVFETTYNVTLGENTAAPVGNVTITDVVTTADATKAQSTDNSDSDDVNQTESSDD